MKISFQYMDLNVYVKYEVRLSGGLCFLVGGVVCFFLVTGNLWLVMLCLSLRDLTNFDFLNSNLGKAGNRESR